MDTAGLRQSDMYLNTPFPKQKPGHTTLLILLVHRLVSYGKET